MGTADGCVPRTGTFQISSAYSRMVRSEENHGIRATLRMLARVQAGTTCQRASMPRWALKWWPSARNAVQDFVLEAGPNHGTTQVSDLLDLLPPNLPVGLIPAGFYQFEPDSNFTKAVNAGGVAVSGLEMSQNSERRSWKVEQLQGMLRDIMDGIHERCLAYGTQSDGHVDYVKGANIAGFKKVADAMLAFGVV